jgi:hypothetical protein
MQRKRKKADPEREKGTSKPKQPATNSSYATKSRFNSETREKRWGAPKAKNTLVY